MAIDTSWIDQKFEHLLITMAPTHSEASLLALVLYLCDDAVRHKAHWRLWSKGQSFVSFVIGKQRYDCQITADDACSFITTIANERHSWRINQCRKGAISIKGEQGLEQMTYHDNGQQINVTIGQKNFCLSRLDKTAALGSLLGDHNITAPMTGTVKAIAVRCGDEVKAGDVLLTMEAMKMEMALSAPMDASVLALNARVGARVEDGALLVELEPLDHE